MNAKALMKAVNGKIVKVCAVVAEKTKQQSPEILVVTGVIGMVAAAVLACRATTKAADILAETQENLEAIHKVQEDEKLSEQYSEQDHKKDLAIVYLQTGWKFVKLYGPSVALGAMSIASILTSNNILKKRNMALAATYAALDKSFKEYRSRVVERFGQEVDKELRYNLKAKEIEEIVVGKNGEEKTVKKTVQVADDTAISPYARFFDESCVGWSKDPEANLMFLNMRQNEANARLVATGYLYLNDVYDMLGIPKTKAGQIVGWRYRPDDPKHIGDNHVDFGIYNIYREKNRDFVNGYERSILLDFNVDGEILNYTEEIEKENHEALWRWRNRK